MALGQTLGRATRDRPCAATWIKKGKGKSKGRKKDIGTDFVSRPLGPTLRRHRDNIKKGKGKSKGRKKGIGTDFVSRPLGPTLRRHRDKEG